MTSNPPPVGFGASPEVVILLPLSLPLLLSPPVGKRVGVGDDTGVPPLIGPGKVGVGIWEDLMVVAEDFEIAVEGVRPIIEADGTPNPLQSVLNSRE